MQFGVCGDPALGTLAKELGYDYFEWSVGGLLHPREDESVFRAALDAARAVGLPCPVTNVFVPGDLKITGDVLDAPALHAYIETAIRRAGIAGVQVIVFGSGAARRIPDGFARADAWAQLVAFGQTLAELGARHGVTVVIEPLNQGETNVLTSVGEGARLVREVDQPNLRLLADGYHWGLDDRSHADLAAAGDLLRHAHVATVEGRRPPSAADPCTPFFAALRAAGYDGRVSFEGNLGDARAELTEALRVMRDQAG